MMRSAGILLGCLALLTVAACSSAEPPPAEGSSRGSISYSGSTFTISISGGAPPQVNLSMMGNTVLDGRNGYQVSCTVKGAGQEFSGHISSQDGTSLDVEGSSAADGATFTASLYGTGTASGTGAGTINTLTDPGCKITTTTAQNEGKLPFVSPGSIWASFQCNHLTTSVAPDSIGHTDIAEFLFTGCKK